MPGFSWEKIEGQIQNHQAGCGQRRDWTPCLSLCTSCHIEKEKRPLPTGGDFRKERFIPSMTRGAMLGLDSV